MADDSERKACPESVMDASESFALWLNGRSFPFMTSALAAQWQGGFCQVSLLALSFFLSLPHKCSQNFNHFHLNMPHHVPVLKSSISSLQVSPCATLLSSCYSQCNKILCVLCAGCRGHASVAAVQQAVASPAHRLCCLMCWLQMESFRVFHVSVVEPPFT